MKNNVFVFVVCGSKEHIDTLHFSLRFLKRHTLNDIIVLTDSSRNEIPILHDHIIEVTPPTSFDHHQASIFLKTGIHKFLPKGPIYCYLDTDVVALNDQVDLIFKEYQAPITFAPDHCKVPKFSPYSVNCGCSEKWEEKRSRFENASLKYDRNRAITDTDVIAKQKKLQAHFEKLKKSIASKFITAIRYVFTFKTFRLNEDFSFDKKNRVWKDVATGKDILYEVDIEKIEAATGFSYNKWTQKWLDEEKNDIWQDECGHLVEYIGNTFNIDISSKNWQHWNGGVFLFDDQSHDFLSSWHKKTLDIFKLVNWKTRDQGTLIATAWEFKLSEHKVLSKNWNFIADYNKLGLDFTQEGEFTDDSWNTKYIPSFLHVYHHWGDEEWSLWQWILKQ